MKKGFRLSSINLCLAVLVGLLVLYLAGCDALSPERGRDEGQNRTDTGFKLPDPPQVPPDAGEVRRGMLYYPDQQRRFLVPVQRSIPFTESIAGVTLEHLVAAPELNSELEAVGLTAALPENTVIRGISINEDLARVDFSASFLNYPPEHERLVLGSVLCTLRQFPSIERLEIMVEGVNMEQFPGGTPGRMPLGPQCWINLEVDNEVEDYRKFTAVKVYFCYPAPNGWVFYVPVTRILPPTEDENLAAVEELLDGPLKGSGLFSDIPRGTRMIAFNLEGGLLELDLSKEILSYQGGRTGVENLVSQILLTLGGLEGVDEIQLLVEGEKVSLKDGPDLTSPIKPPDIYNYF